MSNHSDCCISTGIDDSITAGSGKLSNEGFWEFPCDKCRANALETLRSSKMQQIKFLETQLTEANAKIERLREAINRLNTLVPPEFQNLGFVVESLSDTPPAPYEGLCSFIPKESGPRSWICPSCGATNNEEAGR